MKRLEYTSGKYQRPPYFEWKRIYMTGPTPHHGCYFRDLYISIQYIPFKDNKGGKENLTIKRGYTNIYQGLHDSTEHAIKYAERMILEGEFEEI